MARRKPAFDPPRVRAVLALVVAAGIIGGAVYVARRDPSAQKTQRTATEPLAIVPPGPAFVLTLDVARLRGAKAGEALVGRGLAELKGDACEKALFYAVDALALAVPAGRKLEQPGSDSLAVIATGRFLASAVADCAERGIRARHAEPVRTTIGTFVSVRSRNRAGEVATRDGLLVLSEGTYLRELLDAAEGRRAEGSPEERERDRLHAELRRVVGKGAPVIASLALPERWLDTALGDPEAARSPLATMRSAALRAELSSDVELAGLVACDGAERCARLERFLSDARSDLGPRWVERVALGRKDTRLDVSARLAPDDLAKLWPAGP